MKTFINIIIALSIIMYTTASCYAARHYLNELDSFHVWKLNKRITVWVQPSPYRQDIYNAFREWMVAAGGCLRFVDANTEKNADIKVYFVSDIPDSPKAQGVTTFRAQGKYMVSATIRIQYTNQYNSKIRISDKKVYGVAIHEIGHALGLNGHTKDLNDVMYPTTQFTQVGVHPSARDVATIRTLYCR